MNTIPFSKWYVNFHEHLNAKSHDTFLTLKTEHTEGHFQMAEMGFKKHISDSAMAKLRSLFPSVSGVWYRQYGCGNTNHFFDVMDD